MIDLVVKVSKTFSSFLSISLGKLFKDFHKWLLKNLNKCIKSTAALVSLHLF